MNLFYSDLLPCDQISFTEEESRHISRVLRLREGSTIHLTDGKGMLAQATLLPQEGRICTARIITYEIVQEPQSRRLHIAIAPPKSPDRFEWFLEKATEIGVGKIIPFICTRSEKTVIRNSRMIKVMIAAMKQSLGAWLPELIEPVKFSSYLKQVRPGSRYIAWCEAGDRSQLWNMIPSKGEITILIGPEGDFTSDEVNQSAEYGFIPVSLGKRRLRTETAGIMVCAAVAIKNEE